MMFHEIFVEKFLWAFMNLQDKMMIMLWVWFYEMIYKKHMSIYGISMSIDDMKEMILYMYICKANEMKELMLYMYMYEWYKGDNVWWVPNIAYLDPLTCIC